MFLNGKVTFYRFDYTEEKWIRFTVRAYVFRTYAGKNEKGIETGDKAIIRIPGYPEELKGVKVGGEVFVGSSEAEAPPDDSMKIVLIRENMTGYNRHIRIEAIR